MSTDIDKKIIKLRGVRVHNLKNIDLDIPLNKQIIVTGVSGSGKSSLAFDTLYAEGQRRYIESLSAYARQFLERMDKPDADQIEGITPAIAIQQKAVTKNPRSTVATVTEIYDYLRVLYARIGVVHCLKCGQAVIRDTIDAIVEKLFKRPPETKLTITFSWPKEKGSAVLKRDGFFRVLKDEKIVSLDEQDISSQDELEVFVDRISLDRSDRERLVDSLEIAIKRGDGKVRVRTDTGEDITFSDKLECKTCGILYEDPVPNLFSFNSPQGACPSCHGFGDLAVVDEDKVIPDKSLSLEDGAIEPWTKPGSRRRMYRLIHKAQDRGIRTNVPFRELSPEEQDFILHGDGAYKGVLGFFDRLQRKKYKIQVRVFLARYRKYIPCPDCSQMRLNALALGIKIAGLSIGQIARMTVKQADEFFSGLTMTEFQKQIAEKLLHEIQNRLRFLLKVGLDYITLERMTFTLSGGEAQRINLASALSSSLVGTLFVLDEPSIGLHARDNHRLIEILNSLKDIGNTVMIVEHDPEIIRSAEYLIDLGPQAGKFGGEVVFSGPISEFFNHQGSLTAQYMRGEKNIDIPEKRRHSDNHILINNAEIHNLKNIDIRIPLKVFTCITGVSGSGKSSLLFDVLYKSWQENTNIGCEKILGIKQLDRIIMVDQSPISTSPRSIPATYTKAMDEIRLLFSQTREAKTQGYKPGYFSFNTAGGRCEECKGAGRLIIEMQFLSDVELICEACKGKRFKPEILEVTYQEKNIDDILNMSITEACEFFSGHPKILKKLKPLMDVGLGYLQLGQPTTTLSGGELQRIKLAHNLVHQKNKNILYLFDEPTIGLHPHDISVLLECFQRLVDEGNTVVVIEHNLDLIKCADHIIDLGPEGGDRGGEIVTSGTPEEIIKSDKSHTARYLIKYIHPEF
jgi:excinuclease ABC subunit A